MAIRPPVCAALIMVPMICGCGSSGNRAEIERTRKELEHSRSEIAALKEQVARLTAGTASHGYLEELEKLSVLKEKNALTQEEFDRRKQAILDGQKQAVVTKTMPKSGMEELDRQLRSLHALYNASTITAPERDAKKAKLLQQPLETTDLAKDLETAKALFNASIIQSADFQAIKQNLLGLAGADHH